MGTESSAPGQIIAPPQGGGALQGIGEKFAPDLFTGTGNFTVPIALPPGRNGFNPQLNLVYSTGSGNGPFGSGWSLNIPGVSRKTSKGVPRYDDLTDTFILSAEEDLVPVGTPAPGVTQYRPRTEGLFARILHHRPDVTNNFADNFWEVRTRDGLTSCYGSKGAAGLDPAVIADPGSGKQSKVLAWKLVSTTDPFGNLIQYSYERDAKQTEGAHSWDQIYLSQIRYVDYGTDPVNPSFLVTVAFTYEDRPDPFSDYRAGFEIRTVQRCTRIDIIAGADGKTPVRTYHLDYVDQDASHPELQPPNGLALLHQVRIEGHDGTVSVWLPPLEFAYTQFQPQTRRFAPLQGSLPTNSLADKNLELVDLFGVGLPDILEMNGSVRYWRNQGQGRFALPRQMNEAPPFQLSDAGVQILDANGDGKADLLVTTAALSGYFPLQFGGLWDKRAFQRYQVAPSFDLKDPEVRLVDLDGDGVTDAIRSSTRLECYFNDANSGWIGSRRVERQSLDLFPNVNFSDPRVKWADMTGDGLQDVVLVHDGLIEYWPSLGRGNWAKRIEMPGPRFPWGYDPKRILLGDVDGDGAADLVYVDDMRVTLWINRGGNGWSAPIVIEGTPRVSDQDSIRLVDVLGNGVAGVLWSNNATGVGRANAFFLDFTGGTKPYLLNEMNNHMGSTTRVDYKPSTWFYLQDQQEPARRWMTPLPFPVQVVAQVQSTDLFSGATLTKQYSYHHGYWDGFEREFRGFGRVDQRDTEVFSTSTNVPPQYFSPPTETRTWFHQGAIGDRYDNWTESDALPSQSGQKRFADEYYPEPWPGVQPAAQVLSRPLAMTHFLGGLAAAARRDAFRSMRGKILRTELYALDGTSRQSLPYTVSEHVYGVRQESPPGSSDQNRPPVFFPFELSERTTQWERGTEPLSLFQFMDNCTLTGSALTTVDYDSYGQLVRQINIAVPRARVFQSPATAGEPYLITQTVTTFAQRDDTQRYIVDRTSSATTFEITNDGSAAIFDLAGQIQAGGAARNVINQTLSFYDGDAFQGLPFGTLGGYGALTRTDSLAMTAATLQAAYGTAPPPYLAPGGVPVWTDEYPLEFRQLPILAGYTYPPTDGTSPYEPGYHRETDRRKYDFHDDPTATGRGLVTARQDALGNVTTVQYDQPYDFLPVTVTDALGLVSQATYDYRVFRPLQMTDANDNQTLYSYSSLGLLQSVAVLGKGVEGDTPAAPGTQFSYTFFGVNSAGQSVPTADLGQPISVVTVRREHHATETGIPEPDRDRVIQTVEFSDGFGRLLQTRAQAEDTLFDSATPTQPTFGDAGLPADQSKPAGDAVGQLTTAPNPFVVVSGWQVYDNKGQVVERHEPFFSTGWSYGLPGASQLGQRATFYYDPRGHLIRTVNPDGSEQIIVFGIPGTSGAPDLSNPEVYEPTPWEAYTYDENDNAGRTSPATSSGYQYQWNTPSNIVIDALGRTVLAVRRNRNLQADGSWSSAVEYRTASTYDIRGNLLTVVDALGRTAFTHSYDLANRALLTTSIDGGSRVRVFDAANNLIEQRDSKGALVLHSYDAGNRAIRHWARDGQGQTVGLRERIVYGDDTSGSGLTLVQATAANLRGKPYKHYGEAGLLTFSAYDFKGNLLDSTRNVIAESALLAVFNSPPANWVLTPFRVDWAAATPPPLDTAVYESTTTYDALNRIVTARYPQSVDGTRRVLTPQYNRAGTLESVALDGVSYVDRIAYNAKGQRILIAYGNGQMTRYAYDPQTFRTLRMRTESYTKPSPTTYHPAATPGTPLQEFGYGYDLVGNVLIITDRTPASGIQNTLLGADALNRTFVYDTVYRLISATGRECDVPPSGPPWSDTPRCTDITKVRSYTETYQYDNVGNMALWSHLSGGTPAANRRFILTPGTTTLIPANNQLSQLSVGATDYKYSYDPNGNLTQENTERHFEWDQNDRMRVFRVQPEGAPPSLYAQYLYDSGGQRVMKVVRNQGGGYETTIYVGGAFEHQRSVSGNVTIENNSLHVMDGARRIAIVRIGPALPADGAPDVPIKYHFGDHLGSSNVVASDTGAWINREEYLPYGETSFGSFARKRYRFTGKERDEESGLGYHGARYHAPWLGRWTSCDPLGPADDANIYAYCSCNPLVNIDSSGAADYSGTAPTIAESPIDRDTEPRPDPVAGFVGGVQQSVDPNLKSEPLVCQVPSVRIHPSGLRVPAEGEQLLPRREYLTAAGALAASQGKTHWAELPEIGWGCTACHLVVALGHIPTNQELDLRQLAFASSAMRSALEVESSMLLPAAVPAAPEQSFILYHGTSSNRASKILLSGFRAGGDDAVFFAEDLATAEQFALQTPIPAGAAAPRSFTVLELRVPRDLGEKLGIDLADRELMGAFREGESSVQFGSSAYERVLAGDENIATFNAAMKSGEVQVRRLRVGFGNSSSQ